jgi:hypothetical protein
VLNGDLFEGDLFLPSISSSSSFISSFLHLFNKNTSLFSGAGFTKKF